MGVASVALKAFRILKENPVVILPELIFAILLYSTLYALIPFQSFTNSTYGSIDILHLAGTILVFAAVIFIVTLLLYGLYISVCDQYYRKMRPSLSRAAKESGAHFPGMLGAGILVGAIILGTVAALVAVLLGLTHLQSTWALLLIPIWIAALFIILFIEGVLLYLPYVLVMLERLDPVGAIKRSVAIGRRNIRTILGLLILLGVVEYAAALCADGVLYLIGINLNSLVTHVVEGIIVGIITPWGIFLPVVFYKEHVRRASSKKERKRKR